MTTSTKKHFTRQDRARAQGKEELQKEKGIPGQDNFKHVQVPGKGVASYLA